MIQGGDPTGTVRRTMVAGRVLTEGQGRGGESCWGEKFEDEIDSRLSHK